MKAKIRMLTALTIGLAVLLLILVSAPGNIAADDDVEDCQFRGTLQALNLKDKTAVISGRTWELIPGFTKKNIMPPEARSLWDGATPVTVTYYVSLEKVQGTTSSARPAGSRMIRERNSRDELVRIHRLGGKIWAIQFPGSP
jgi:hypothetical protein